jgi:hypothetical protein
MFGTTFLFASGRGVSAQILGDPFGFRDGFELPFDLWGITYDADIRTAARDGRNGETSISAWSGPRRRRNA